jgi:hypothetical protein
MTRMIAFLLWLLLLFVCWPLALLALPFLLVWGVIRLAFGGVKAALEVVEILVRILTAPFRIAFRRK